jgi:hypothetical protein
MPVKSSTTPLNVAGSVGLTPNNKFRIERVKAREPEMPIATPTPANASPSRRIIRATVALVLVQISDWDPVGRVYLVDQE